MAKRKIRKKWLYEAYKEQHPEIFGKKKILNVTMIEKMFWKVKPVMIVIILNVIAIGMMMLLNTDIRAWIFRNL